MEYNIYIYYSVVFFTFTQVRFLLFFKLVLHHSYRTEQACINTIDRQIITGGKIQENNNTIACTPTQFIHPHSPTHSSGRFAMYRNLTVIYILHVHEAAGSCGP